MFTHRPISGRIIIICVYYSFANTQYEAIIRKQILNSKTIVATGRTARMRLVPFEYFVALKYRNEINKIKTFRA